MHMIRRAPRSSLTQKHHADMISKTISKYWTAKGYAIQIKVAHIYRDATTFTNKKGMQSTKYTSVYPLESNIGPRGFPPRRL